MSRQEIMRKFFFLIVTTCLLSAPAWAQRKPRTTTAPKETGAVPASANPIQDADRLFSHGEDAGRDRQALAIIERALAADSNNYQLLWRAARLNYFVGDSASSAEKLRYFERGIEVGKAAVAQQPNGVEGHFWLAANYGGYSEVKGALKALQTVKNIRAEMETVVRLSPSYEDAGAYLALGELDRQLPRLFGGNMKRAISYLEQGLRLAPQNMDLKLALAEAYLDSGRKDDGRRLLQEIVQMPINPARAKEARETQDKARQLLNK